MRMARRSRPLNLPAPYLRRAWLHDVPEIDADCYPLNLPLFRDGFEIAFERPVSILVGENGVGKSTVLEGLAGLAGFDEAGGGKGYKPLDHSRVLAKSGTELKTHLRAAWRPKLGGWFFKAETFFSVARYLDDVARESGGAAPDFLSHSHGEGFLRFFEERCSRQGVYFFDEPESALSPSRQVEFLKLLRRMEGSGHCQVIMVTHAPLLMAYPDAQLLRLSKDTIGPVRLEDTDHFRLMRHFCDDPDRFISEALGA
jgi:predicted ATPase